MKTAILAAKTVPDLMEGIMTAESTTTSADDSGAEPLERSIPSQAGRSDRVQQQMRHDQQCLYRMGAGATMFEVEDPDPYAVDGGRVLGVRIEVCVGGRNYTLTNIAAPSQVLI